MIPALLERAIELMKTTTLAGAVSYTDLLFEANSVAQSTYRPLEVLSITAMIYFVIITLASLGVHRVEQRLALRSETS
jgi:polar amino acid transport system permease protein